MTMLMARFERTKNDHGQVCHRVPCRTCQRKTDIVRTGQSDIPPEVIAKKAIQRGWEVDKRGLATCPVCLEAQTKPRKEPAVKTTTATGVIPPADNVLPVPPRSATPTDLRRIMREIDDNWDEAKGMYSGNMSDQIIADKLNVPRAWVVEERKRAFGESQRNEHFDTLLREAKTLERECRTTIQSALDKASLLETQMGQLALMIKRLEKLG